MPKSGSHNNQKKSVAELYGSRRGCILTHAYRVMHFLGRYRRYKQIDWGSVNRLVFVCKGNICRSAYAEAVARSLGVESISCGIDTVDGKSANADAIRVAAIKGINLSNHKTRKLSSILIQTGDLVVAMEPCQTKYIEQLFGEDHVFTLMGLWNAPITPYINDPYGKSLSYFVNCFDYIEKSVFEMSKKITGC